MLYKLKLEEYLFVSSGLRKTHDPYTYRIHAIKVFKVTKLKKKNEILNGILSSVSIFEHLQYHARLSTNNKHDDSNTFIVT